MLHVIPEDYGKSRGLAAQLGATELVLIGVGQDGQDVRLTPATAKAWGSMKDAASNAGITLLAISGFRSVERQAEIIRAKLSAGEEIDSILKVIAAPGYSEHHTGRAIDIAVPGEPPLTEAFALSAAFQWLESRAKDFGFRMSYPRDNIHGISYEPWHWFHEGH